MEDEEDLGPGKKRPHPRAEMLEAVIRKRLLARKEELGLSEEELGKRTFRALGWRDKQKKAGNLLSGRTKMRLTDFYILCEGLELQPDRVFTAALDEALQHKAEYLRLKVQAGGPASGAGADGKGGYQERLPGRIKDDAGRSAENEAGNGR